MPRKSRTIVRLSGPLVDAFPDLMKEWDWEENRDLDPASLSPGSAKRAHWKCAGQWVQGHFVLASTFVFVPTLTFLIGSIREGRSLTDLAFALVDYFEKGEVGPVETE